MSLEVPYGLKLAQLEKAIGELNALVVMHYNPQNPKDSQYLELKEMVEKVTKELRNTL